MKLSERIKAARKHAGLSQSQLADRVGIAQTAISQLESGKTLRSSYLLQIAEACGVAPMWLATDMGGMLMSPAQARFHEESKAKWEAFEEGMALAYAEQNEPLPWDESVSEAQDQDERDQPEDFELSIPCIREVESPNEGTPSLEQSGTVRIRFTVEAIRTHGINPAHTRCTKIAGNSMEPALTDGSLIAINTNQRNVVDGKIFALEHAGQLRVRIVYRVPGGGIRLRSFNPTEHPDESYTSSDMEQHSIKIMGRVFWAASFFT